MKTLTNQLIKEIKKISNEFKSINNVDVTSYERKEAILNLLDDLLTHVVHKEGVRYSIRAY